MSKDKNPRMIQETINNIKVYKNVLLTFGNHVEEWKFLNVEKVCGNQKMGNVDFHVINLSSLHIYNFWINGKYGR
jgi:hypothetical protein